MITTNAMISVLKFLGLTYNDAVNSIYCFTKTGKVEVNAVFIICDKEFKTGEEK